MIPYLRNDTQVDGETVTPVSSSTQSWISPTNRLTTWVDGGRGGTTLYDHYRAAFHSYDGFFRTGFFGSHYSRVRGFCPAARLNTYRTPKTVPIQAAPTGWNGSRRHLPKGAYRGGGNLRTVEGNRIGKLREQ